MKKRRLSGTKIALYFVLTASATLSSSQTRDAAAAAARMKVYVDGKPLPAARVLVKDGATYVEATTIAEALGASAQSGPNGYIVTTNATKNECERSVVQGQQFSQDFRIDVAGVADEIESLRAVVQGKEKEKLEKVPLGPRFDKIDRTLALSTPHVQTDADRAVYYALSYASNSLAISYYKQVRGIPTDKNDQLDSMICSMESKFALMKGMLMPGGTCSVFKRLETQGLPKPEEIAHPPNSGPSN